jgi:hypothetical protein
MNHDLFERRRFSRGRALNQESQWCLSSRQDVPLKPHF